MNQYHSSQLYNAMLENMQDGFLHCRAIDDSEGKLLDFEIIEINKSLRELIQIQEDIRHKKFSEVLSMNSGIFFYFAKLTEKLTYIKAEESFEFNNSSMNKWHSVSIFPELDKHYLILVKDITKQKIYSDQERYYNAAARDITKRKSIEEQLRESEERWQFALEGSEAGVWDWNIETSEQIYSRGWKRMLGYEEHEIQPNIQEWISRVHPDDIEHGKQLTRDYLNGVIPAYNNEHRLRCKDGSYKWILSRAKIVKWSPDGKPLRMTGTHTDITELKSLVEELTELTNDYEIVFNGTQDALFLVSVDDDGKLRYNRLNSSHERLTGLKTKQVKGKTPQEVVGKKQGRKIEANYKRCVRKKGVIRYEEQMELPTGNKIWYTRLSPVIRDGRVAYIVGSSRDITEQKSMEDYKKKVNDEIRILNESIAYENLKTEFFSNLSHELRTPLNVILCSVQLTNLLIDNSGNQKLKESITRYMQIMKQNSFRLLRLVNNIIDITKIDSGYAGLTLENTDIVGLAKDIVMSIEAYVQNKSIKLSFNSQIKQRIIAIDMDKIERIILNLLSNAVKFTEAEGEIDVKLFEKNDSVFISIKDNGIGIPEDKQEVIFDRFVQIDKSLTRRQEGSGIGLALVKTMVELHKGKISVKSKLGQGSEFIVSLPIYSIDDKEIVDYSQSKADRDMRELISMEFSDIYS
ncbi:MAG: resE5 [Clostridia bacterium]|nr:resE5 [Clostridia bacterium]